MFFENESTLYEFIISSYSNSGEILFMGESDDYTYIMAYHEEDGWDNSSIYVFDSSLRSDNILN